MSTSERSPSRKQHITIKEVAEQAGVSQMTVSRVLNRQGLVKDATRERVEKVINELNYRPNLMARRLAGGNSLYIGLVYHNPSHGYLSQLLVGALNYCRSAGHHLVLEDLSLEHGSLDRDAVSTHLREAGLDGVILTPPLSENVQVLAALRDIDLPFVRVAPGTLNHSDLSVAIDDCAAADAITQYLIDKGHKQIGIIVGPSDHASSQQRLRGFKQAMSRNNIKVNQDLIASGAFTYRSGMEAAEQLFQIGTIPTAIFASNDDMAAGVIAAANRFGLKVPAQLSVVGFDDTEIATTIWPQLTTIRQPIAEMAQKTVALLSGVIQGSIETLQERSILLDHSIVERDTVASLKH